MKVTVNRGNGREKVDEIEFHLNGEMMWIRFYFKDGTKEDTFVFKGGV